MPLATGARLGPYEIVSKIGEGGMGEVYRCQDTRLLRQVAIKLLDASLGTAQEHRFWRFQQEAKTVSTLSHPNVIAIYDVGNYDDVPYIVMELLEGEPLRSVLQAGTPPLRSSLSYAIQIASGLSYAHEKGIVHRDLKPENIFITHSGMVKILDFGLAKLMVEEVNKPDSKLSTSPVTQPGMILGTLGYMSPEQTKGEFTDARSDIFAFGAILYEMLSGKRAFEGNAAVEILSATIRDEPDIGCLHSKKLPVELVRIIGRCLRKDVGERFQSSRDLTFALRMIETNLDSPKLETEKYEASGAGFETGSSIAVLPFVDRSPEKDQDYFCDGLTEELITALAKMENLHVASRTSAFQFKGHQEDIRNIARQLGVKTVLEGSVRKAGNRIRITAELIHASDGYHLWSEKYDREMDDIFAVQEEIARMIVDALKIKLGRRTSGSLIKIYTRNPKAYSLYLEGRYHWSRAHNTGMIKAIHYFQGAIEKDPSYALAYAGLADAYSMGGMYAFQKPALIYPLAKQAAVKSLELDPDLAEGHLSMAAIHLYFEYDWEKSIREAQHSVDLKPDYVWGSCWYSAFLSLMGRFKSAAVEIQKAQEYDPLSPLFASFAGFHYFMQRQYDRALRELQKALEFNPEFVVALWWASLCYLKESLFENAVGLMTKAVEICNRNPFFLGCFGLILAESRNKDDAEAVLQELKERSAKEYIAPLHLARVYVGLGRVDEAFTELEKAVEEKNILIFVPLSPEFDLLRSDARFPLLLRRLNAVT